MAPELTEAEKAALGANGHGSNTEQVVAGAVPQGDIVIAPQVSREEYDRLMAEKQQTDQRLAAIEARLTGPSTAAPAQQQFATMTKTTIAVPTLVV